MAFDMAATEESFLAGATRRVVVDVTVGRPAPEMWAELTEDGPKAPYCRALSSITRTSPRPCGVGTTRPTRALGGLLYAVRRTVQPADPAHTYTGLLGVVLLVT